MSERPTSMQPSELLRRVIELFPAFEEQWQSPENCYRNDDGSFTYCGVFSELTAYSQDNAETLSDDSLVGLAALLSECMDGTNSVLDESAATCFLENIWGDAISRRLKPHLSGEPLKFLSQFPD